MEPFLANIEELTLNNDNFRKVIYTGIHSQLVLMSLLPGEEIGFETHPHVDQFFRVEMGSGMLVVGENQYSILENFAMLVPAGAIHNIRNDGETALKMYTLYSSQNHIDGRIHKTKKDAELDTEDEEFATINKNEN